MPSATPHSPSSPNRSSSTTTTSITTSRPATPSNAGHGPDLDLAAVSIAQCPEQGAKAKPVLEPRPLRIAILLNSYRSRLLPAIRGSYQRTIGAVAPLAKLAFYEPANRPGEFPNPDYFDLIVLGGSNVDPRKRYPWILEVHGFVRRMVRDYPHKKLLGICWGHQTISNVFGGKLADAAVPEMGVASVTLTGRGREFFNEAAASGSFKLQQHHRREVVAEPHGFVALARGNQCFLSASNAMLTFQGHPEKDAETARLRAHDSVRWFGFDAASDEKAWAQLEALINADHDGEMVWRRILEWAREPCSEAGVVEQQEALALAEEKASKM
ncbi:putative class I glutamine amidotransferase-like protein [Rosellinia necatrix]|uniref:Putative class I glutamine amidotransferase-like protein n=1 Tax=Rosellinia necatrix TaxID=77044 RepID=A0A1W2TJR7_ROSNE|nr:putative class I glutamine amidotransferase-like protein [Rosellinia necatrix]